MKHLQIMVSIDGSVKHCSFWNICNICRVLSARAVGRAWTGNSRTDSPSNHFYASLATRMFPLPWIKTVFILHSDNRTTADSWLCCTTVHFTDLVSHCFLEGIVNAASPNHLWFQCLRHDADLQINSNGSKLILNWNCPIFLQVMFFLYLLPDRKYE